MSDDLEDGGIPEEEIKEPSDREPRLNKKIMVIVVVIVVVLASFSIWYFLLRPIPIRDLGEEIVDWYDPPYFNPDLAGKSFTVGGEITGFLRVNSTTFGPMVFVELDDYRDLSLVVWGKRDIKIGDYIVRDVHFEWGHYNDEEGVFSPQLNFPVLENEFYLYYQSLAYSQFGGLYLIPRDDPSSNATIVATLPVWAESFPLSLFNASLRKLTGRSWHVYTLSYEIDYMETLEQQTGNNGTLAFIDANSDGLLDRNDYFRLNLSRPLEDSSVFTYQLLVNGGVLGAGVLEGEAHIVMTKRGTLGFLDLTVPEETDVTWAGMKILSQIVTSGGVTVSIEVKNMWGDLPLEDAECELWSVSLALDCLTLDNGEVISEMGINVTFLDEDSNGMVSEGDVFEIEGLTNLANYSFRVKKNDNRLSGISWQAGLGATTANVPIIEWFESEILDFPVNRKYKLQIDRMYGMPGVFLGGDYQRMVVDIKKDGLSVLSFENLTVDFNQSVDGLNVTFEDADDNGYLNSGDYFIAVSTSSAGFELILGYVNTSKYRDHEQPLISWSVSWHTD